MNRNQVIPMIINERTTLDIILDQIEYYLKQNNTNPNINLEIEGKLGFFKLKQICKEDQLKFLEIVSENNYILLDKTFFETNFESGVNYQVFHNNLDYFRRVYKQSKRVGNENFNENDGLKEYFFNIANYGEIREGISVDYVQKGKNGNKKQRATYEIGHGISYMEKNNKIHLNILHNSKKLAFLCFFIYKFFYFIKFRVFSIFFHILQNFIYFSLFSIFLVIIEKHYRVSVNSEEKKPLPTDFFSNLSSIRVKHRTIFPFQFFEFHFTEVITLPPNNNVIESPTESPEFDIKLINLFSQENVQKT